MTFDNRPVRRNDNENPRPRPKTASGAQRTGARPQQGSGARTVTGSARTGAARPASASRTGARPASQASRSAAARRPANPANSRASAARRPAPKSKKPTWLNQRVGRFDMETLLAMALILVVLVAVGFITVKIVSGVSKRNTTVENRYDLANITRADEGNAGAASASSGDTASQQRTDIFGDNTVNNTNAGNTGSAETTNAAVPSATQPVATVASVGTVPSSGLRSARIRTVGDFVISKEMIDTAKAYANNNGSTLKYDFSGMLSVIGEYMGNADFTVANVDGSMGGKYRHGYTGYPQINTPEMLIQNLKDVGVDMLTLANNHMLDGWYDGLLAEIDNVDAAGLYHVGAYRTQEERDTPCIVEINGIKVGFMNYTESLNNFENYGVDKKALEYGCGWIKNSNCTEDAKRLRNAGADVIVCYMHWGEEYTTKVNKNQTDQAQKLMKAGVDIIVGGHPHVVQHAEWLTGTNQFGEPQRTFCIFSLGNYLTDHTAKNTDGGIIFDFTIQEKGDGTFEITAPSYITTYVWKTGSDLFGRGYVVVPCAAYVNNKTRPSGMSDSEYQAMVTSHNNQVAIMNEGVGAQKTY
ncbi:MAG: CapA family protein [Clostridia bacterium]|nr:CapA family protein [Clostridia bacterium]